MAYHFQSELDNLDNETIKAVEEYTEKTVEEWLLHRLAREFENTTDTEKIDFLEDLVIDLNLKDFNLTDIQEIIIAYMFVNDLYSKEYTDEVMELLDMALL